MSYIGTPIQQVISTANQVFTFTTQEFTATGGQTSFTVTGGYTAGLVDGLLNGVQLAAADFTATDLTTFVLTVAANAGDQIVVRKWASYTGLNLPSGALVGTTDTQTLENKTLSGPVPIIASTGTPATLTASGVDANININLVPKGNGTVLINGAAMTSAGSAIFMYQNFGGL